MNWLSFVASDLHKGFSPLFALGGISPDKAVQDRVRAWTVGNVKACLAYLDAGIVGKDYVMGKTFTVADAYAFVVTNWTQWMDIPLADYKNVKAYLARILERPAVQKVYREEGLLT